MTVQQRRTLATLVLLVSSLALADTELGATLPDNARKVGERRYKSPSDWEGTLKFYRKVYSPKDYRPIINQPGVKAIHIPNVSGKGGWAGLNIYETNDEVRIYVVPNDDGSGSKKGSSKPKK